MEPAVIEFWDVTVKSSEPDARLYVTDGDEDTVITRLRHVESMLRELASPRQDNPPWAALEYLSIWRNHATADVKPIIRISGTPTWRYMVYCYRDGWVVDIRRAKYNSQGRLVSWEQYGTVAA